MRAAIEGSCLCGAVRVAAARLPRSLTQCNCTVCRKYGTLWAYYRRNAVSITAPARGLEAFSVQAKGLRFVRCAGCGCITSWQPRSRAPEDRLGMNARLFDHAAIANVPVRVLDGDRTWRVLERYTKPAMLISPTRTSRA